MFDRWYDAIEGQIDWFMDTAINILLYVSAAGMILLAIVQGIKVIE